MYPYIYITQNIVIPTYLLVISLTYCLCILFVYWRAKNRPEFAVSRALDICLVIMVCGLMGARLFHVFYEDFNYYRQSPWDIFKLWHGGFVIYGGFIGALLGSILFLRYKKEPFWQWANFMAPAFALGYGLGRLACFFNGCCFGRECQLPWAVEFSYIGLPSGHRHPTQLYATFWELGVFFLLLHLEKSKRPKPIFLIWLCLHAIGRLIMEHFRDDFRGPEIMGLSVSSWLSISILGLALVTNFVSKAAK
ncbi:MAG: prolipoprotein diacylglyceryl transferase [Bdellovibrionales bacterium RBG_16_40_8]|nr:MAG: prolipoprotein diacylglyceryl transferase [Bdellovibrionales bacterium RBG_16_40_8]